MVKKFEEWLNEGFWKDGVKRAKNNTIRLGDGVKLDLGIKVEVNNRNIDYDALAIELLGLKQGGWMLGRPYYQLSDEVRNRDLSDSGEAKGLKCCAFKISDDRDDEQDDGYVEIPYKEMVQHLKIDIDMDDFFMLCKGLVEKMKEYGVVAHHSRGWQNIIQYTDIALPIYTFKGVDEKTQEKLLEKFMRKLGDQHQFDFDLHSLYHGHNLHIYENTIYCSVHYNIMKYYDEVIKFTEDYFNNL